MKHAVEKTKHSLQVRKGMQHTSKFFSNVTGAAPVYKTGTSGKDQHDLRHWVNLNPDLSPIFDQLVEVMDAEAVSSDQPDYGQDSYDEQTLAASRVPLNIPAPVAIPNPWSKRAAELASAIAPSASRAASRRNSLGLNRPISGLRSTGNSAVAPQAPRVRRNSIQSTLSRPSSAISAGPRRNSLTSQSMIAPRRNSFSTVVPTVGFVCKYLL
jgi:hypothetical protein